MPAIASLSYVFVLSLLAQNILGYELMNLVKEFYIKDQVSCRSVGGKCQNATEQCNGSYISSNCDRVAGLKCCSPKIQVQDTGDCPGLPILSRDTWGAAIPKAIEKLALPVNMFFIHHTEMEHCDNTESCSSSMRIIQRFHMKDRGWSDIAYGFLIGGDGQVYKGRGWDHVGSNTYRYNYVSLAVAFIGDFNDTMPGSIALSAAQKLLTCGVHRNAIKISYSLYGHRDARNTSCPGYTLYNAIRKWEHYNVTTDEDGPCLQKGGLCGPTYLPCKGRYHEGLCDGYYKRQCCIPNQKAKVKKLPMSPSTLIGGVNCYGDFMLLRPTGKKSGGVQESQRDVDYHLSLANEFHSCFVQVGNEVCLHPAVIAGVASRESNFGYSLTPDGWGDHHQAYGMMQCDFRICPVCRCGLSCTKYKFDSCDHIRMMSRYTLVPFIQAVKVKFPTWLPQQHIQGGVAAYNFGVGNVRSWANLDVGTTGGDYSNDVIARAQWLVTRYKW
ncbi:uncharacterized protein LOC125647490 [Ostrea edulis]|uniref:uncharacterized protein LOC125647490 n=1 Tax=Ostrea edulis TaxID=37623 RepID=UPI00209652C6|nr:uncharacterized protein LOC125647490 [Ostrea edulis]